jgi:hypothetical protein
MAYVAQALPAAGRTLYLTVRTATRNPLLGRVSPAELHVVLQVTAGGVHLDVGPRRSVTTTRWG